MNDTNKEVKSNFESYTTKAFTKLTEKLFKVTFLIVHLTILISPPIIGIIATSLWFFKDYGFLPESLPLSTQVGLCILLSVYFSFMIFGLEITSDLGKRNENKVICLPDLRQDKS
ncbi:hypothetical protein ACE34W_004661 [Vibrio parahaemolyticus]